MAGEERFAALVETMLGLGDATYGTSGAGPQRAFGSTSLKSGGKIFAMLVSGRLVVKLPRGAWTNSSRPAPASAWTPATAG